MIIQGTNDKHIKIGTKAENLFMLLEKGYRVPSLFCISGAYEYNKKEIEEYLINNYSKDTLFAVRSSSMAEDGAMKSFAGQFETFLDVKYDDVLSRIDQVFTMIESESIKEYCNHNHYELNQIKMNVIVQEMIPSELSGVLFTANPQGILNEMVVVLGKGNGNLVVEDRVETTTYYYNCTDEIFYYEQNGTSPILKEDKLIELINLGKSIRALFGKEIDIEFAFYQDNLYVLQVRPITTLNMEGDNIILDNSNIVESYPGITLPLTQSFIKEVYYRIFQSLLIRLAGNKIIHEMDHVLKNMIDVANGRVYYRISNWYNIMLLLPFNRKIIPVWQEMMGVSIKNDKIQSGVPIRLQTRLKVISSFFSLLLTCPRKMKKLDSSFYEANHYYQSLKINCLNNQQIFDSYKYLVDLVMKKWDITLVNDMYTFIFTGLLKRCIKHKTDNYEIVTKQYISKISEIESLKPIRELTQLAKCAKSGNYLEELQALRTNDDYRNYSLTHQEDFVKSINNYIDQYGDRNLEELKLESRTYRTDPILLIQKIVQYADDNFELKENSEVAYREKLRGYIGFVAKRAALGIQNREKSRLYRGRLYGMMRTLMLKIGENLKGNKQLDEVEDIFWLFEPEVKALITNEKFDLKDVIKDRKMKYKMYEALPAYTRLVFADQVKDKNPSRVCDMSFDRKEGVYTGVACSGGIVEGEVLVVDRPELKLNTKDKILVTKMTDPGWVFLIAQAKAIVAEKGSLLSHTAIIARELEKPAVVNVSNITKLLHSGEKIRVDGNKGEITIVNRRK